jgi:uncharacterized protein YbjQ (UPF0145 family)
VQGWVRTGDGTLEWRPIVATAGKLDRWQIATYLGIAAGQAVVGAEPAPDALARARSLAIERLVEDALGRGAHGVVGVGVTFTDSAAGTIVQAMGTAVTLANIG